MKRLSQYVGGVAILCLVAGVETVGAQVFTPTFMAPRQASDVGIYLSDGPGSFSVEGIWRGSTAGYDLGVRVGLADTDDLSVLLGAELRNPVAVGAPIDLAVTGSAQGVFGGRSGAGFLLGLVVGHTFATPGLAFTPYLHPRVGLVQPLRHSDFELDLLADLGFDVRISPRLDLRLGVALDGHGAGWGVGFAWR
jgi:hypothetical protein